MILGQGILFASLILTAGFSDNQTLVTLGLFLLGLGWSCPLLAGSAIVTDETDPDERPSVQGLSDLSMNVAGAVGGAAAGIIVMVSSYGWLCAAALVPLVVLLGVSPVARVRR